MGPPFDAPSHQADAFETVHTFYRPLAANAVRAYPKNPRDISEFTVSATPQLVDWKIPLEISELKVSVPPPTRRMDDLRSNME